jgi:hypothetical protein
MLFSDLLHLLTGGLKLLHKNSLKCKVILYVIWAGIAYSVLRLAMGWTVRGWKPGGGEILSPFITGHGTHQPPLKWAPGHSWGKSDRGVAFTTHPI